MKCRRIVSLLRHGLALLALSSGVNPALAQFAARSSVSVSQRVMSIAVGDFNRDGNQDVAIVDTEILWIYFGNGDGTLGNPQRYHVGKSPQAVAAADLNGDGIVDLVVADTPNATLYLGTGAGDGTFRFSPLAHTPGSPTFIGIADLNADHKLDIVALAGFYVCTLLNSGNGKFAPVTTTKISFGAQGAAWGDFNLDGKLDIAIAGYYAVSNDLAILLGNGDGTFSLGSTYHPGALPVSVAVGDFRSNGMSDLVVANELGGLTIFLGNGDGTFSQRDQFPTILPANIVVADVNGDGHPDLVVAENFIDSNPLLGGFAFLPGKGDGTFLKPENVISGRSAWFIALGDFNGDKQPDVIVGTLRKDIVAQVFLNTGNTRFSPAGPFGFPPQLIGTKSALQTLNLANVGKTDIEISSVTAAGQFEIGTNSCTGSIAPGSVCTITLSSQPTGKGTQSGVITIADNASLKPQTVELDGAGTVVSFLPSALEFPGQKVGTHSQPQKVIVTNTGPTTLNLRLIQLNGTNWQQFSESDDCGSHVDSRLSCTITITYAPTRTGKVTAEIDVFDDGGGGFQFVPITGRGI